MPPVRQCMVLSGSKRMTSRESACAELSSPPYYISSNQWLMFCLPFALLLFSVILPVLVLILLKKPCRRLRTRCVAKYVFRGPPKGALALNMRTDVIDCVIGAAIICVFVVEGVDVVARVQGDPKVARNGDEVDVSIVEKSLFVVGIVDVRRREIERGLYDELDQSDYSRRSARKEEHW